MGLLLSKSKPLFREGLKVAPAHPQGDRCFVLPMPVASKSEGGIEIADVAKERTFAGVLLAAGDLAADKFYDSDFRLGDEVWYGKFSGVIEEWQRIVKDGEGPACPHDSVWEFVPRDDRRWSVVKQQDEDMQLRACRGCGALKLSQRVIMLSGEDVLCSVDAQLRRERGITRRVRDTDAEGRTRYRIEREAGFVDTFETGKEA